MLTEYRKIIRPQDHPTQFIDETLKPCSDQFEIIRDQRFSCDNQEDETEINRLFGWLNRIDNTDWFSSAIYFLVKHNHQSQQIKDFFIELERLAAGYMILRVPINKRAARYKQLLNAIEESAEAAIGKAKELLSSEEKSQIVQIIDGDLYLQRTNRYILLRLDSAIAEGGLSPSFDAKMVTIEHVLPQTPKPDGKRCTNWNETQREQWVHRLGNLVLLSHKKNSSAKNHDFQTKKDKYFNRQNVTIFPITTNVINQDQWTVDVVQKNQQQYLQKLIDIWNLHP